MLTLDAIYDRCEEFGECRIWQQAAINGQPQARINGKGGVLVRRYIFTELLGKKIPPKHVVTPRCREQLCVSSECLQCISYSTRMRRMYAEGVRGNADGYMRQVRQRQRLGRTVLDFDTARALRLRTETHAELAREFGCDPKTIASARSGKSWRDGAMRSSVFTLAATGTLL